MILTGEYVLIVYIRPLISQHLNDRLFLISQRHYNTSFMANLDHSELNGEDLHLEKHESPETSSHDFVDIPAGYFPVTTEEKALSRALNIKLDVFLLPFLSMLYLFNGLDRGNVGNAQTQGQISF
jgi:hypothetical protein